MDSAEERNEMEAAAAEAFQLSLHFRHSHPIPRQASFPTNLDGNLGA